MPRVNRQTRNITRRKQQEYLRELRQAANSGRAVETEVIAPVYRRVISEYFGQNSWQFDENTDGYFVDDSLFMSLRLLLEAKYDKDLRNINDRAAIVAQCIYYMKKFEHSGLEQPNVIFGADQDQMFAVYAPPPCGGT